VFLLGRQRELELAIHSCSRTVLRPNGHHRDLPEASLVRTIVRLSKQMRFVKAAEERKILRQIRADVAQPQPAITRAATLASEF
jgi:hypothetical protein